MRIKTQPGNKDDRYTLFLIIASCACLIVQLYALPRNDTRLMSLANRGLLVLWYALGCLRILKHFFQSIPKHLVSAVWLLGVSACSIVLSALETPSSVVANSISLLNFFVLPVMFLYSAFYPIPQRGKTIILITNILLSVVFLQLYHSDFRNLAYSVYGEYESDVVSLGYTNPNQTAMFLFACLIGLMVGMYYFKHKLVKYLLAADYAYIAWIMYQTESRTAFIILLLFTSLAIFNFVRRLTKPFITLCLWAPLVYASLALIAPAFFTDVTVFGDTLFNGRDAIYQKYSENLTIITFLFGDFNKFRFDNMHNGYLSIAATAGVSAAVCFVLLLKKRIEDSRLGALTRRYSTVAFLGFLCIVLCTSTEAAFFVGGSTYAFDIFMIFALFCQPIPKKLLQSEVSGT